MKDAQNGTQKKKFKEKKNVFVTETFANYFFFFQFIIS